jgi:hypothetical protein
MTEPYPLPASANEFADKRVLVTGGTRGIGAATSLRGTPHSHSIVPGGFDVTS